MEELTGQEQPDSSIVARVLKLRECMGLEIFPRLPSPEAIDLEPPEYSSGFEESAENANQLSQEKWRDWNQWTQWVEYLNQL